MSRSPRATGACSSSTMGTTRCSCSATCDKSHPRGSRPGLAVSLATAGPDRAGPSVEAPRQAGPLRGLSGCGRAGSKKSTSDTWLIEPGPSATSAPERAGLSGWDCRAGTVGLGLSGWDCARWDCRAGLSGWDCRDCSSRAPRRTGHECGAAFEWEGRAGVRGRDFNAKLRRR